MDKETKIESENFIYYSNKENGIVLADIDYCSQSDRTLDIRLFDLANNEKLLNKLHLYYIHGNYGKKFTYESRASWFCGYLSSLNSKEKGKYKKLITNPVIRVLVTNNNLLTEVKKVLK